MAATTHTTDDKARITLPGSFANCTVLMEQVSETAAYGGGTPGVSDAADCRIERLNSTHERGEFSCGKPLPDDFLRLRVSQYDEKRRLGRTYVAVFPGQTKVAGYYTLAAGAIPFANLPSDVAKRLPKHPVPVILLARLAVDENARGQELGKALLQDALRRCLEMSEQLGLYAVEVQAIDAKAKGFSSKYGFVPVADNELHLFLPIKTIEKGRGNEGEAG